MSNAPFAVLFLTALATVLVSLVRRQHFLAAVITGVIAGAIALIVLLVPINEALTLFGIPFRLESEWVILGRSLFIDDTNRNAIGYLYISGGFILSGSWTVKPIRMFLPLGLGILFLVASSLMIVPFLFAAVFIEIAVVAGLLMLTTRKPGAYRGGMRLLVFYTFGMFALLLSGWAVDIGGIISDTSVLSDRAQLLLYFGFSVLLAIPPFHSWIPIASEETHPFALGFTVLIVQAAGLFFFIRFMNAFTWIWTDHSNLLILRTVGAGLAVLGALWAVVQDKITKLGSYAMISDVGVMLIAIGFGNAAGFQIALALLAARAIGISCWSIGIATHRSFGEMDEISREGNSKDAWLSKLVMVAGILSLAGVPLTAGFPGRWQLIQMSVADEMYPWLSILVSMSLIGYAAMKQVFRGEFGTIAEVGPAPEFLSRIFLLGGLGVNILLGLFPQVLIPWVMQTVLGFSTSGP